MNHSGINMKIAMQPFPSFQIIIGPPSFRLTVSFYCLSQFLLSVMVLGSYSVIWQWIAIIAIAFTSAIKA